MKRMFRGNPLYALGWLMGKLDCAMVPREGRKLRLRMANRERLGVAVGERILGFTIEDLSKAPTAERKKRPRLELQAREKPRQGEG